MFRALIKLSLCLAVGTLLHAQGIITTIAGGDETYPSGSFSAFSATFGSLAGVAVSPSGDVYFASSTRSVILKFNPQRDSLTVVAGNGAAGYSGDGGPAVNAAMNQPGPLAMDQSGNLYVGDHNNSCIRRIDPQGVITTFVRGFSGDLAVAPDGSVYTVGSSRIVRLSGDGSFTVIAGSQQPGYAGDGGPASQALLDTPRFPAIDGSGNLYFADIGNKRIRRVAIDGTISTFAGNGQPGFAVSGQLATATPFQFLGPLAVDAAGNLYESTGGGLVRIDSKGIATILNPSPDSYFLNGPVPLHNAIFGAASMAFDRSGTLYFTDNTYLAVLTPAGNVQAVAAYSPASPIGDGGPALSAILSSPSGLALRQDGSLLVADTFNLRIRSISPVGGITTVAGTGSPGKPAAGAALSTNFINPAYITSDSAGGFLVSGANQVAHVTSTGTTLAGLGILGSQGVAVDSKGNLLVAEAVANQVVSISADGSTTTVIAGNGTAGFSGDGGPATAASLNLPQGIVVDANGVLYIADLNNNRIRKVTPDGIITTLFSSPNTEGYMGLAMDRQGNLYVAANYAHVVEKISPSGAATMIAGGYYVPGFSGDGGQAKFALLNRPSGVAVDDTGNVYIADTGNNRIRKILATQPSFAVSTTQVRLSAAPQGPPVSTDVAVTSSAPGLAYGISFSTVSGGDWLVIGSLQKTAPGVLTISADPSHLQPGTYNGTVTLASPVASPTTLTISVTLTVGASQPSKLSLNTKSLAFAFTAGNGPASQQLSVSNAGASVSFTASEATVSGGSWLQVSPSTGTASAASPGTLTVTASPGSLPPGTYSGTVTIASSATGDQLIVPVTMAISATQQSIQLSQTGLTFTAVAQGGAVLPQSFGILNAGSGSMNWTAQATTLSGSGWLSLSATSGTVSTPLLDVSFVDVLVNAQSLAPGNYFGSILVSAPGAANSPQAITVVLNVLPPGSNPGPEVRPTGLVFTGVGGGNNNPGSQSVNVSNLAGMKQLSYGSSPTYVNGSNWLTYLPSNATLDTATPTRIVVQPDFTVLTPGIYRGAITLALTDGSIRTVGILSVVAPGTAAAQSEGLRLLPAAKCSPSQLQMQILTPQQAFTASLSQPVAMEVQVVDDCGTPVTPQRGAAVSASFSNSDPAVSMVHTQNGKWSGTW
ncbi:MAG TPA: hypothetical protein VGZ73_01200, partial [Bryobacteraceae bacterium]|nr:hypothetical protein [Bryobacteraceae bacterium]